MYFIYQGITEFYRDLRKVFSWNDMNRDIVDFMANYPNCHQLKVEHQKPSGMTHQINIHTWKWQVKDMNFNTCVTPQKFTFQI